MGDRRHGRQARLSFALFANLVTVALFCLTACGQEGGQPLQRWSLDAPGAAPRTIELPVHLDQLPDQVLTYRLSTTIELTPELVGREVELLLTYLPARVTLRVNGQLARLQGNRGWIDEYGGTMPRRWLLPAAATNSETPITLVLEVTHSWTHSAWLNAVPELVLAGESVAQADRNQLLNEQGGWFGLITLSQVGITFLLIYFWDRRRRAYLWFAIQALTASYYPAYVLGLPALGLGWATQTVLLAQSLGVATIISVYLTHAFFELPPPNRIWLVLLGIALVSPLTVVVRDHHFLDLSYAAPIVVACVLSAVVYQIAIGLRLLRSYSDRGTVVFFLCCWVALGTSSWVDLLAWLGTDLLSGGRPACVGLGVFGLFQSVLLGRSHFRSLAEADRLNDRLRGQVRDLEERQSDIATLNEELRRQIGRRSAEILTALTAGDRGIQLEVTPGLVIEARYRVLKTLGSGGMGTVFEVERLSDRKHFALKVSQEIRGMALARLAKEAQIATRVHHDNVVSVVDADVAQGGYAYLVMELVQGPTLAECGEGRRLAWYMEVLRQVLEGIKALHAQNIIHRDLKPNNILLADAESEKPRVKITDFGISRWLESEAESEAEGTETQVSSSGRTVSMRAPRVGDTDPGSAPIQARVLSAQDAKSSPHLTRTGAISGTPLYVAPELADGGLALSPAVDVFSFGVVAYKLLTGKQSHLEAPLLARMAGRPIAPVTPLNSLCPAISPDLASALEACLTPEPMDRPSVEALLTLVNTELEQLQDAAAAAVARH